MSHQSSHAADGNIATMTGLSEPGNRHVSVCGVLRSVLACSHRMCLGLCQSVCVVPSSNFATSEVAIGSQMLRLKHTRTITMRSIYQRLSKITRRASTRSRVVTSNHSPLLRPETLTLDNTPYRECLRFVKCASAAHLQQKSV